MTALTATFQTATGAASEGLCVAFFAPECITAIADAGGVITVDLLPETRYQVALLTAGWVDGTWYDPGTVLAVEVGEEPTTLGASIVEVIDASIPTLLATIAELTARLDALEVA